MNNQVAHAISSAETMARVSLVALAAMLAAYAPAALCYVGPGAGLGMIATLIAVVLAVVATIVGLVMWPIRKFMRRKKQATPEVENSKPDGGD